MERKLVAYMEPLIASRTSPRDARDEHAAKGKGRGLDKKQVP